MEFYQLQNGMSIPAIGMGTGWMNTAYRSPKYLLKRVMSETKDRIKGRYSKEKNYTVSYELRKLRKFKKSLKQSRSIGYSLYDTAYSYNNCGMMGECLSKGKRDDLFIISKCANSAQRLNTVREEFEKTLRDLNTDYIDLYLIHWPQTGTFIETWKVLEEIYKSGKAKAIGVSNFQIHHIEEIRQNCTIMPMVNEVECHPLLQQNDLRDYCKNNNIQLIAHTSTGKMRSNIKETVLKEIADKHKKSITQVILRWHFQLGDISICNSLNPNHMRENLQIFDFSLSDEEMNCIGDMDSNFRIWPNPDNCDFGKLG